MCCSIVSRGKCASAHFLSKVTCHRISANGKSVGNRKSSANLRGRGGRSAQQAARDACTVVPTRTFDA